MARTTRKVVESAFRYLMEEMSLPIATAYNDVGAYALDAIPEYGGYIIVQIISEGGAETHPFGSVRQSGSVFVDMCHFTVNALRVAEKAKEGAA